MQGLCSMVFRWFTVNIFFFFFSFSLFCHSHRTKHTLEQTTTANLVEYTTFSFASAASDRCCCCLCPFHTHTRSHLQTVQIILVWILFIFFAHAFSKQCTITLFTHTRMFYSRLVAVLVLYECVLPRSYMLAHSFACVCI